MISSPLYVGLYYNSLLLIVVFFIFFSKKNIKISIVNDKRNSIFLLCVLLLYISFRPIDSKYFGDTEAYKRIFDSFSWGWSSSFYTKDTGFYYLTYLLSIFCNITAYFAVIGMLYILPVLFAFKSEFKRNYYVAFLVYVTSFSFWGYGVNGLRNGAATSIILLAFFCRDRKVAFASLSLLAVFCFHKSVIFPLFFFVVAKYVTRTKLYISFWLLSIPLFFLFGEVVSTLVSTWGILGGDDERLTAYFSPGDEYDVTKFSSVGFRFDFVLYSAIPVVLGYIYIYVKKFNNAFYTRLYNTYLVCNGCWILVISVAYSNRFAYLSWFLIPVIITYPLLKEIIFSNQRKVVLMIVFFNYLFTYVYWLMK